MPRTTLAAAAVLAFTLPAAAQNGVFYQIPGWDQLGGLSRDGRWAVGRQGSTAIRYDLLTHSSTVIGSGFATGISDDGSVACGFSQTTGGDIFRWTQPTGATPIGRGSTFWYPSLSADGSTIAGNAGNAFRWSTSGGFQDLSGNGNPTYAFQISADGSTVVGDTLVPNVGLFPAIWRGTQLTIPGPNSAMANSELDAVNADGSVAFGVHLDDTTDAFRWNAQTGNQDLGFAGGGIPFPAACTADGGIFIGATFGGQGWVWRSGTSPRLLTDVLRNDFGIDLTGVRLFDPRSISADGRVIAGTGEYTQTTVHFAWVITLPWSIPSPGSAIPLAALMFAPRRRRYTRG